MATLVDRTFHAGHTLRSLRALSEPEVMDLLGEPSERRLLMGGNIRRWSQGGSLSIIADENGRGLRPLCTLIVSHQLLDPVTSLDAVLRALVGVEPEDAPHPPTETPDGFRWPYWPGIGQLTIQIDPECTVIEADDPIIDDGGRHEPERAVA